MIKVEEFDMKTHECISTFLIDIKFVSGEKLRMFEKVNGFMK